MKKALAIILSFVMLMTMGVTAFAYIEVDETTDLTGYVDVKIAEPETLNDGDVYITPEQFRIDYINCVLIPFFLSGDGGGSGDYSTTKTYDMLTAEEKAQADALIDQHAAGEDFTFMYHPSTHNICITILDTDAVFTPNEAENEDPDDARFGIYIYQTMTKDLKTYSESADTDTPAEPDNGGNNAGENGNFFSNLWAKIVAFFQKIGDFIKNLFKK